MLLFKKFQESVSIIFPDVIRKMATKRKRRLHTIRCQEIVFRKFQFHLTLRSVMKKYFLKLYHYNAWANKRVMDTLTRQTVNDEKILNLMGHIVAAQFLWLHRIKGLPPPELKLWGTYTLSQLLDLADKAGKQWLEFVEATDDFDRQLTYKNYVGDPYTNNVEMIMVHLVNHSSYHRAQIAMLLRQKGLDPINTDFITYDRVITGQLKD